MLISSSFRSLGAIVFSAHLLIGTTALLLADIVDPDNWLWLAPFCVTSLLLLGYLISRSLKAEPAGVLYETGLFLSASCATYFSFGPLLYVLGPADAVRNSMSWHRIDAADSLWLIGLNFIGLALTGLSYISVQLRWLSQVTDVAAKRWARLSLTRVFVALALVGVLAKYLLVLPYELGLSTSIPSGLVRQMARLLVVALLIGWAYRKTSPRWMRSLAGILLVTEIVTGLLMFNKTEVLIVIVTVAIANYARNARLRGLIRSVGIGLVVYVLVGPVITFGRNELTYLGNGEPAPAELSERLGIVAMYFTGGEAHARQKQIAGAWWSRLNYLPSQQSAIVLYDQGHGSDDLNRAMWVFVPRLLYPAKPTLTGAGVDLTEKVKGTRHSSTGIGIFADGYYILGWLGVLLASVTYGFALRAYAAISRAVVTRKAVIMYPLVLIGIYAGLRADGWWLADVAGPTIVILFSAGLFRLLSRA